MSEAHLAEATNGLRYASCYEYREGSAVPYTDDRESSTAQCVAFGDFSWG